MPAVGAGAPAPAEGRLGDGRGRGDGRCDRRGRGRLARLVRGQLGLQLVVLGDGLAPLDDDLVKEVVDLVRVETLLEPNVLELLGDDVIGGQCHGDSSFERSGRWPMSGADRPRRPVVSGKHSRAILRVWKGSGRPETKQVSPRASA